MSSPIRAYAVKAKGAPLEPYEFDPGPLSDDHVEIKVQSCGICHSDLAMIVNEWGMSRYPIVAGHEVVGTIAAVGGAVKSLKVGQTVGLGWYSSSCLICRQCMSGDHNLCASVQPTIVGRFGGFADRVRCQAAWALPLPDGVDAKTAGPLFCGGITVYNPLVQFDVRPADRVGVIGIGGLGHLALQFLAKWGCEVVAFSSSEGKTEEAMKLGAHKVVNSKDPKAFGKLKGSLNLILSTATADLDWPAYLGCLAPKGRLHFVGAVAKPVALPVFPMLVGQASVSGSPLGGPATTLQMLDFCARHKIAPVSEHFPMSRVNDALAHLAAGKARYRIILENDFR